MELVNERINEHLLQIEHLTMIKQQNDEKNSHMKENIDKTETEDYNLLQFLKNKCIDLKNRYVGIHCSKEEQIIFEQLRDKKRKNRRGAIVPTDICESDYELLLSKVVMDMNEEIQNYNSKNT
jgi:hypothetical protein